MNKDKEDVGDGQREKTREPMAAMVRVVVNIQRKPRSDWKEEDLAPLTGEQKTAVMVLVITDDIIVLQPRGLDPHALIEQQMEIARTLVG